MDTSFEEITTTEQRAAMIKQAYEVGIKNLEFSISSGDALNRDANNAVNLICGAGIGALAFAAHLLEQKSPAP